MKHGPSAPPPPPPPGAPQFNVRIAPVYDDSAFDYQTQKQLAEVRRHSAILRSEFDAATQALKKAKEAGGSVDVYVKELNRARVAYELYRSQQYQPYSRFQRERYIPLTIQISDIENRRIPAVTEKLNKATSTLKALHESVKKKREMLLEHHAELTVEQDMRAAIEQIELKIRTTASVSMIDAIQRELIKAEESAKDEISDYKKQVEHLKELKKEAEGEVGPLKAIYEAIPPLPKKQTSTAPKPILPIDKEWLFPGVPPSTSGDPSIPAGPLAKGLYVENLRDFALYKDEVGAGYEHILSLTPTRKSGQYEEVTLGKAYQKLSSNPDFTLDTLVSIASGLTRRPVGVFCKTRLPERLDVFLKGAEYNKEAESLFTLLKASLLQNDPKKAALPSKEETEEALAAIQEQVEQANYLVQDDPTDEKGKEKETEDTKEKSAYSLRALEEKLLLNEQKLKEAVAGDRVGVRGAGTIVDFEDEERAFQSANQRLNEKLGEVDKLINALKEAEAFFEVDVDEDAPLEKRTAKTLDLAKQKCLEENRKREVAEKECLEENRKREVAEKECLEENKKREVAEKAKEAAEEESLASEKRREEYRKISEESEKRRKEAEKEKEIVKEEAKRALEKERGERANAVAHARQEGREEARTPADIIKQFGYQGVYEALKLYADDNNGQSAPLNVVKSWGTFISQKERPTFNRFLATYKPAAPTNPSAIRPGRK